MNLQALLQAISRAVDPVALERELGALVRPAAAGGASGAEPPGERLLLADLLDDSILGAKSGDKAFPLRLLLAAAGERLEQETAFAFLNGLNFFFRAAMDEEVKALVGIEVSALFYRFVGGEEGVDRDLGPRAAPLLASLLSTELERLRYESVDHQRVFDSQVHEREPGADASSANVLRAGSFLCRVTATAMVRHKARVRT